MPSWLWVAVMLSGLTGLIVAWWAHRSHRQHQARQRQAVRKHALLWFEAQSRHLDAQRRVAS